MNKAKIISKLLKNPHLWKNNDFYNDVISSYFDSTEPAKPNCKKNYVGIEIECYAPLYKKDVLALMVKHNLEDYLDVAEDGSIEPSGDEFAYEFRILVLESALSSVLKKLQKFLKEGKFKANWSCGLHVHLDMRNRDVEECYRKLLKFQDVMFGMVSSNRWDSDYCNWADGITNRFNRFTAINRLAYERHKTLEVRLHHGTVDVVKIESWVNLLLKMVKAKSAPEVKCKQDVLKWAGNNKKLKSYINKEFKSRWFEQRKYYAPNDMNNGGEESEAS